jgi:hypothetical protein
MHAVSKHFSSDQELNAEQANEIRTPTEFSRIHRMGGGASPRVGLDAAELDVLVNNIL